MPESTCRENLASNCCVNVNIHAIDEMNRPSTSGLGDTTVNSNETSDVNGGPSTSSDGCGVNLKSLLKRRSPSVSGVAKPTVSSADSNGDTSAEPHRSSLAASNRPPHQSVAFAMTNEETMPPDEENERRPEDGQEDSLPHFLKSGGSVSIVSEESSIFAPSSTASSTCTLTAYRPKARTVVAVADFADKKDLSSRLEFGGNGPNSHNHGQDRTSPINRNGSPQQKGGYSFFGGAISDIRNRFPQYKSDIYDAANFQCLTSVVFMFFAAFAPAITFGGLMGKYTNEKIGTIETLFAQCICGVLWGLFSAQPLMIMSATGPVLIFEASLYTFCENLHLDFMIVRFYTGVWIFSIAVLIAALDGSRLLAYVTRFTEDIFATLISAIFIAESLHFVWQTFKENPVEDYQYYLRIHTNCQNATFMATNSAAASAMMALANSYAMGGGGAATGIDGIIPLPAPLPLRVDVDGDAVRNANDTAAAANRFAAALAEAKRQMVVGQQQLRNSRRCGDAEPNTALLTAIIMFSTFALAFCMKKLRESFYLGRQLRRAIGDFGVLISIVVVAVGAYAFIPDPYLQRLDMPDTISFTNRARRGHGLFIDAQLNEHNWYGVFVALFAAMLIFILLFVETEITELLLMRRERGCRKGSGMNWDLVLMGVCALLCSVFGLPWMCAAAVQSLAHCSSLTVMKKKAAGQPPEVDHVIEQRITTIGVSLLIGLIAFAGSYLRLPLASLFGVFLYLGVMNLSGVQLIQRSVLFLIPEKYFPTTPYTQEMGIFRMHLYTWIQLCCLFVVYVVKYFKRTALAFPFVLMLFIVIRHTLLPKIFTEKELRAVDGDSDEEDETWMEKDFYEHSRIPV